MNAVGNLPSFWTPAMIAKWNKKFPKGAKTTHENCIEVFGVARPGKTARERAKLA